ncbi:MAG: VWA domain-containing protein [Pirellulaceae bacterium]
MWLSLGTWRPDAINSDNTIGSAPFASYEPQERRMTFLNDLLLLGLIGISIPILIHLFNRRRAKVIEWERCKSLLGSIVNRRRRVLIEELILMVLRCLLVAVVVLMLARPFAPVGAAIGWGLLIPGLLLVAMLAAVGAIVARRLWARVAVYSAAILLAMGLVALSSSQSSWHSGLWSDDAAQDLVVILDGSSSMNAKLEDRTNFARAVNEFRELLAELPPDAHVSLLVAGSTTRIVTPVPLDVRSDWTAILAPLAAPGGSFDAVEALATAATVLQQGDYPSKRIVLISDGQHLGWHGDDPRRWEFLKSRFESLPTKPKVIARFLPLPESPRNAAVAELSLSRRLVAVGQPTTLRIRIENSGSATLASSGLQVQFDAGDAASLEVPELPAGQSTQLELVCQFDQPGAHVVQVKWLGVDDLGDDDSRSLVVPVVDRLPVLLVDGSGASRFLEQATAFVEIALAPAIDDVDGPSDPNLALERPFVEVTSIAAADLPPEIDFDDYEVVMLCDVPRLGSSIANRLRDYVVHGGGLIVAPGARADPSFYGEWSSQDGIPVLPGKLLERVIVREGETPSRPAVESFAHAALTRLASAGPHDLGRVDVRAHWRIEPLEGGEALVGARFDLGDAWLVEQTLGRGKVLLLATALDDQDSLLPSNVSFLPLVHELTYSVSAASTIELNRDPASILTFELPVDPQIASAIAGDTAENETDSTASTIDAGDWTRVTPVTLADGGRANARWELRDGFVVVSIAGVAQPGVHSVEVPALFESHVPMRVQERGADEDSGRGLPVAVRLDPRESHFEPRDQADESMAASHVDWFQADDTDQLIAAIVGDIPGGNCGRCSRFSPSR